MNLYKLPIYKTPNAFLCPDCHEPCTIIALDNSFSDQLGIIYPPGYGDPITNCCEADVPDAELDEPDYYNYGD